MPEGLRDHALSASGGTITGVTRVDGAKDLFELTVEPAGDGAVTVTLVPPPGGCAAEGAVCTASGKALSSLLAATVAKGGTESPGDPDGFTASYSNVPASHGGEPFTYDMDFSAGHDRADELPDAQVRRRASDRCHGAAREAPAAGTRPRLEDPHHFRTRAPATWSWSLPATTDCAAAGAVCDADGKMLTSGYSFTVPRNRAGVDVGGRRHGQRIGRLARLRGQHRADQRRRHRLPGVHAGGHPQPRTSNFTPVDATFTIEAGDSSTTVSVAHRRRRHRRRGRDRRSPPRPGLDPGLRLVLEGGRDRHH